MTYNKKYTKKNDKRKQNKDMYNTIFKNFFNKFVLVSRSKKVQFLNLGNKKKDLNSRNKIIKEGEYYYSFDKYKSGGVILIDKLP